jgi:hypothetical protein
MRATEFEIVFGCREAEKGWSDLRATARNSAVDAPKGSRAAGLVVLERVSTAHPNETVKVYR